MSRIVDKNSSLSNQSLAITDTSHTLPDESKDSFDMRLTRARINTSDATRQNARNGLCRLPKELKTMIWSYVIADCRPVIFHAPWRSWEHDSAYAIDRVDYGDHFNDTYGVYSTDDYDYGEHAPHALVHVCKHISTDFREQMYQTAIIKLIYKRDYPLPQRVPLPIRRLTMSFEDARARLRVITPLVGNESGQTSRQLLLQIAPPGLKHLELVWKVPHVDALDYDWNSTRNEIMLARLLWYKKSFEVTIKIKLRAFGVTAHFNSGDTLVKFEYETNATKNNDRKKLDVIIEGLLNAGRCSDRHERFEGTVCCKKHSRRAVLLDQRHPYTSEPQKSC